MFHDPAYTVRSIFDYPSDHSLALRSRQRPREILSSEQVTLTVLLDLRARDPCMASNFCPRPHGGCISTFL